jgi:hypothetical protein
MTNYITNQYLQQRWVPAIASGIPPAHALVKITGATTLGELLVEQTDGLTDYMHCIGDHYGAGNTEFFSVTLDLPAWVLYDDSVTPSPGELWVPASSQWKIKRGPGGGSRGNFAIYGGADGTKVLVGPPRCTC